LVCETSLTTSMYQTGAVAAHQLFTAVYGLNRGFSRSRESSFFGQEKSQRINALAYLLFHYV